MEGTVLLSLGKGACQIEKIIVEGARSCIFLSYNTVPVDASMTIPDSPSISGPWGQEMSAEESGVSAAGDSPA